MKSLLNSTIFLLLGFTTLGQGQTRKINTSCTERCTIQTREVIDIGLMSWRAVYHTLEELGVIDRVEIFDTISFKQESLDSLYGQAIDSNSQGIIVFRYYMSEDTKTPKLAIGNCGDTCRYLIDVNGREQIVTTTEKPELLQDFQRWRTFLNDRSGALIYVTSYNYCWSSIGKGINTSESNGTLYIENVAHTVSPNDTSYKLPDNTIYEGYVAFDLALAFEEAVLTDNKISTESLGSPSKSIDFAAPCPKVCNQSTRCQ